MISIHAPVWGRPPLQILIFSPSLFQSTPPYGGDLEAHEETVGAEDFNPRPRMGATAEHGNNHRVIQFQSTPPYGGDDKTYYGVGYQQDFNPRPRMGATEDKPSVPAAARISIHAPVWGRLLAIAFVARLYRFQSTPPYGGDISLPLISKLYVGFQSTPPYGGDF